MEVLFLYLKQYGPFREQEFNFTSNHIFKYEKCTHKLSYQNFPVLPEKFFSNKKDLSGNIQISALVGNNGSGKTSVAQIITKILLQDEDIFEHILIFKIENTFYMSCLLLPSDPSNALIEKISQLDQQKNSYNLQDERKKLQDTPLGIHIVSPGSQYRDVPSAWNQIKEITKSSVYEQEYNRFIKKYAPSIAKVSFDELKGISCFAGEIKDYKLDNNNAFKIIYHSNFYNTTDNWAHLENYSNDSATVEFLNISTTSFLYNAYEKYLNPTQGEESTSRYIQTEMFRKYELLSQSKFLAREKTFCKKINLPIGIRIEANSNDWNRWLRDYKSSCLPLSEIEEYLRKISKYKEDIFFSALNFWKEFFMAIFGNWAYYHTLNKNIRIKWHNPDRIRKFFEELDDSLSCYFDYNSNPDPEQESKGLPLFVEELFQKYIDDKLLFEAENQDGILFTNLTPSLSDIYQLICLLNKYIFDKKAPYIEINEKTLEDFEKIWELHDRIATITSFLSAEYTPSPSSGEISVLSMYTRLYNALRDYYDIRCKTNVIIFLDETEITMHPELQRTIISDLITFCTEFVPNYSIHMMFLTHSPILLSDIPIGNVCFLCKNKVENKSEVVKNREINNTFGCNIFELFKNSFFLDNGTMGEFSQTKINNILTKVNADSLLNFSESDLLVTRQIGDEIIREYIEQLIMNKCDDENIIKLLIEKYQKYTSELQKKLGEKNDKN